VSAYDLVLDCTDHPTSRYLISDMAVLLGKPLVSASALRTDGQLMVLNSPPAAQGDPSGGPCYRCVFPKPPPPDSVISCGEGGILGPVVGVMGVLQALEAIRMIASGGLDESTSVKGIHGGTEARESHEPPRAQPSMLLFSAGQGPSFRSVRMRGRRKDCFACSEASGLTLSTLRDGSMDYVAFCGGVVPVEVLQPEDRISALEYDRICKEGKKCLLLDVREKELFELGCIDGAVNVPYSRILATRRRDRNTEREADLPDWIPAGLERHTPVYVICRVGNDSQLVAQKLKETTGFANGGARFIGDIEGGMRAWKADVDDTMPFS